MLYCLSPACVPRPVVARMQVRTRPAPRIVRSAKRALKATEDGEGSETTVLEEEETLTGEELRALVAAKWGRLYDTRLCQRRDQFNNKKMYLQVMWKFVGQKSFPLTEEQYNEQVDAVAELISEWGVADEARKGIAACKDRPQLDTVSSHAVMIPLPVDV